jgi:hypothetical protein
MKTYRFSRPLRSSHFQHPHPIPSAQQLIHRPDAPRMEINLPSSVFLILQLVRSCTALGSCEPNAAFDQGFQLP